MRRSNSASAWRTRARTHTHTPLFPLFFDLFLFLSLRFLEHIRKDFFTKFVHGGQKLNRGKYRKFMHGELVRIPSFTLILFADTKRVSHTHMCTVIKSAHYSSLTHSHLLLALGILHDEQRSGQAEGCDDGSGGGEGDHGQELAYAQISHPSLSLSIYQSLSLPLFLNSVSDWKGEVLSFLPFILPQRRQWRGGRSWRSSNRQRKCWRWKCLFDFFC